MLVVVALQAHHQISGKLLKVGEWTLNNEHRGLAGADAIAWLQDLPPSKGKQRATAVSVEDEDDEDMQTATDSYSAEQDEQDGYNRAAPPGGDGDYFADEDEDGRFFGGGLSSTQKQILDIFDKGDQAGGDDPAAQTTTIQSVRRQLLNLERAINKNSEMRIKWSGQPDKFV